MRLRRAEPAEFPAIRRFYWDLIDEMAPQSAVIGWKKGIYPTDDYLRESLMRGELYVLDDGGSHAACVILSSSCNEGYAGVPWGIPCREEEVLIPHALGVRPSMQGRGIGAQVVADIISIAAASGKKALRLDILGGNAAAARLYEKMGFRRVQAKPMYYEDTGLTEYVLYERGM